MPAVAELAHRLARVIAARDCGDAADAELLSRFATGRDEAAFTALVRRHGGLVYDVCRCVLGNDADAEDAFQATFLVLARSAGSVRRGGSLAAWLYGVARRVSLKARTAAARRRGHEAARPAPPATDDPDDLTWREVRRVVHEELAQLPAAYRDPLVLCHLRGLTQDAAARELGLTRAAVQKRLERGLAKLRAALAGRGLGPAVVLAAATPAPAVPPALADATIALAADSAAAIPAHILTLADGGTTVIPGKLAALWLVPALVVGVALAGHPGAAESPARTPAPAPAADDKKPTPGEQEVKWLAGEWKLKHAETNGEALLTNEELKDARVVFKGDKAEVKGFEVSYVRDFSFKLDLTKNPKEIDVTFTAGPEKGTTVEGIYLVRKNEMRMCLRLTNPELGRPKGYVTNSGTTLYTFVLEPADKKPDPPVVARPKENPPAVPPDGAVLKSLKARVVVRGPEPVQGVKVYTAVLEVESPAGRVAEVSVEPNGLALELTDADGRGVRESALGRANRGGNAQTGMIPAGGYVGFPVGWAGGITLPRDGSLFLAGNQDWTPAPGKYAVKGTATLTLPSRSAAEPRRVKIDLTPTTLTVE